MNQKLTECNNTDIKGAEFNYNRNFKVMYKVYPFSSIALADSATKRLQSYLRQKARHDQISNTHG